MGVLYASLTSRMNEKRYKVYIRGEYDPVLPAYFREGLGPPVSEDLGEEAVSMMTIPFIIDMCFNEVPFRFVHDDDIDEIISVTKEYMEETKSFVDRSENLSVFFARATTALKSLEYAKHRRDTYLNNTTRKYTPKDALTTMLKYL